MRIISGKWRGRRLVAFKSDAIRPTTDRVKETIFNMIGPDIVGASVLDLFAGTGSLGFEALSRGAEHVLAVDKGADSKKIVEKNKSLIGVDEGYEFRSDEIIRFLTKEKRQFDYIFVDPPFTLKMGAEVMKALDQSAVLKPDTRIFIEYVKGEEIPEDFTHLLLEKAKNYGDKLMYSYIIKE
jgi:16S rRNA (guanine966-N2)-methyltransferase